MRKKNKKVIQKYDERYFMQPLFDGNEHLNGKKAFPTLTGTGMYFINELVHFSAVLLQVHKKSIRRGDSNHVRCCKRYDFG
jgi:hypothetical protein